MFRPFRILALAAAALAMPHLAGAANSISPGELAGWWLAIDDLHERLTTSVPLWPVEELLVLDASGSAEVRFMTFVPVTAMSCVYTRTCSDAPLAATTTFTVAGDLLAFARPVPVGEGDPRPRDPRRVAASAAATPVWKASLSGAGAVLFLEPLGGGEKRTFARVEPAKLGRLRAGFIEALLPVLQWRCYLAHATAGEPAFLPLYRGDPPPPAWFNDYLAAASYIESLDYVASFPPPDHPNPKVAIFAKAPKEVKLLEPFPDLGIAPVMDVWHGLDLAQRYLASRVLDGLDDAAAQATLAAEAKGVHVGVWISEAQIRRLAGAKTDPEIAAMAACPAP